MAVYLHYVGERWYTDERFIQEGKDMGVQRLTSYTMVKKLFNERAIIYYARYDRNRNYARVFAKGKVTGVASTSMTFRSILGDKVHKEGQGMWTREVRRCGTCFSCIIFMDEEEIDKVLEEIPKEEQHKSRWFILSNIEPYNTGIDNRIEYKVKTRHIVVHDIAFTRGFIKLCGGKDGKIGKAIMKAIKMHRLRDSNEYDDVISKVKVDLSKYTQLDKWLGGVSP
jgi:hypothetical protein